MQDTPFGGSCHIPEALVPCDSFPGLAASRGSRRASRSVPQSFHPCVPWVLPAPTSPAVEAVEVTRALSLLYSP